MKTIINAIVLSLFLSLSSFSQTTLSGVKYDSDKEFTILDGIISEYTLYQIDVDRSTMNFSKSNNQVILDFEDRYIDLNLYPDNVMTSFEAENKPILLGGSINTGGKVCLTLNEDFLYGFIRYRDKELFIEPLWYIEKTAPKDIYIVYFAHDVIEDGSHICGVQETNKKSREIRFKMPTTMCKIVDLGIANTYDMYTSYNNSTTDVMNHNLAVLNNVQSNYRSEFDANLEFDVVAHFVPTSSGADPFPASFNALTLLNNLDSWGAGGGNSGGSGGGFSIDYTQASLWTARDIYYPNPADTHVVGLAHTPGWHHVLEDYTSSAASLMSMVSHEKAHNWDAVSSSATFHDASGSGFIMAPTVTVTRTWSTASVSDLNARVASQTYLDDCGNVQAPTADAFQSAVAVCINEDIEFEDQSAYADSRDWEFFSGTPATSTDEKDSVSWSTAGLWAVKIKANNSMGSDSTFKYVDIETEPGNQCTPSGSGGTAGITRVLLGDFLSPTGYISNTSGNANSAGRYENFVCSETAIVEEDTDYTIAVTVQASGNSYFSMFCDYNGDGDFTDTDEEIGNWTLLFGSATYFVPFTTEMNPATEEILRFRIIHSEATINGNECHNPANGQVEDYGLYFDVVQIFGCTDPAATNYDNTATVDDGSCTFGSQTWYQDSDSDNFGNPNVSQMSGSQPAGYVLDDTDCDDTDGTIYPGAAELCDGQINDCNTGSLPQDEIDNDGDQYVECTIDAGGWDGVGSVIGGDDCDDADANNYPGNTEVCDEQDNDCDGDIDEGVQNTYYRDVDGDNFGNLSLPINACTPPSGYVGNSTDCDDSDNTVYPNAPELCDGQINNCNTGSLPLNEVDNDGDNFVECTIDAGGWDGVGSVIGGDDCDDADSNNYPGNTEVCDGQDNDCDTLVDEGLENTYYRDLDGDTYGDNGTTTQACTAPSGYVSDNTDCNDNNSAVNPGANESCDGIDNDCDTIVDEGCQPCDGDYLVINTITQNSYYAEINITSDALLNNGQAILFSAGTDIDLEGDFEVVSGTEFTAIIEDCIPIAFKGEDETEFLKSANTKELVDQIESLLEDKEVQFRVFDRWGNEFGSKSTLMNNLENEINSVIQDIEAGFYMLLVEQGDKKIAQRLLIVNE